MFVIPVAVAYDQIAGVPRQAVFAPASSALLAYALFGTSRQVVVGSTSSIATLNAAIIATIAEADLERYLELAAGLAMLVEILMVMVDSRILQIYPPIYPLWGMVFSCVIDYTAY